MDPLKTLLDAKANGQGMAPHVMPPDRTPPGPRPIDPPGGPHMTPPPSDLPGGYKQWQPPATPTPGPHQMPPLPKPGEHPADWQALGAPRPEGTPPPTDYQPFDFESVPPPDHTLIGPLDERMSWLLGPTQRPDEPVTAGHPVGTGPAFVIRPSETTDQFRNRVADSLSEVPFLRDDPNMMMYLNRLRRGF